MIISCSHSVRPPIPGYQGKNCWYVFAECVKYYQGASKSLFWTFVSSFHSDIFCCSFGFLTFTLSFEEESKRSGHIGAEKFQGKGD